MRNDENKDAGSSEKMETDTDKKSSEDQNNKKEDQNNINIISRDTQSSLVRDQNIKETIRNEREEIKLSEKHGILGWFKKQYDKIKKSFLKINNLQPNQINNKKKFKRKKRKTYPNANPNNSNNKKNKKLDENNDNNNRPNILNRLEKLSERQIITITNEDIRETESSEDNNISLKLNYSKSVFYFILFLNIFLPGIGTIIAGIGWGKKCENKNRTKELIIRGIIQFFTFIFLVGWIQGIIDAWNYFEINIC